MVTHNIPVFVQPPNKPQRRRQVGYIASGCKPEACDLERWGVQPGEILEMRERRSYGVQCLLIIKVS